MTQQAPGPEKPGWETAATMLFIKRRDDWDEIGRVVADNAERPTVSATVVLVVREPGDDNLEVVIEISGPGHVAYLHHTYAPRGTALDP